LTNTSKKATVQRTQSIPIWEGQDQISHLVILTLLQKYNLKNAGVGEAPIQHVLTLVLVQRGSFASFQLLLQKFQVVRKPDDKVWWRERIKQDSHVYACQANHYNWVYPQEKWKVSRNQFMSVKDTQKEEERWLLKEVAEKKALRKWS